MSQAVGLGGTSLDIALLFGTGTVDGRIYRYFRSLSTCWKRRVLARWVGAAEFTVCLARAIDLAIARVGTLLLSPPQVLLVAEQESVGVWRTGAVTRLARIGAVFTIFVAGCNDLSNGFVNVGKAGAVQGAGLNVMPCRWCTSSTGALLDAGGLLVDAAVVARLIARLYARFDGPTGTRSRRALARWRWRSWPARIEGRARTLAWRGDRCYRNSRRISWNARE